MLDALELRDKTLVGSCRKRMYSWESPEVPAMQLTDFVADVPDDVWAVFEPILPPRRLAGRRL